MDLKQLDLESSGERFYNQLQILEYLVIKILNSFSEIAALESFDDYTKLQIKIKDKVFELFISYMPNAIILDSTNTLTLYVRHYIRPFQKKSYSISEQNKFSNLIIPSKLPSLYSCVKSQFIHTSTVFFILPKVLISEILYFLDKKSFASFICLNKDIKIMMDDRSIWKGLYYLKYGNLEFQKKDLDWKQIYTVNKSKENPLKSLN